MFLTLISQDKYLLLYIMFMALSNTDPFFWQSFSQLLGHKAIYRRIYDLFDKDTVLSIHTQLHKRIKSF